MFGIHIIVNFCILLLFVYKSEVSVLYLYLIFLLLFDLFCKNIKNNFMLQENMQELLNF